MKSLTINNLPDGDHTIKYTSDNRSYKNSLDKEMSVIIENGKIITKLVEVPQLSNDYWVYMGAALLLQA